MTYNDKKVILSVIYRSPSLNNSEFDLFLSNFEKLLNDVNKRELFLSVITGDFPHGGLTTSILKRDQNVFH